jgi:hypothetical protein
MLFLCSYTTDVIVEINERSEHTPATQAALRYAEAAAADDAH